MSTGIITNCLVLITVLSSCKLRGNSAGILIISLACVDGLTNGIILIDNHLSPAKPYCYLIKHPLRVVGALSAVMMMLISINRYALVCRPFTHDRITSRKSMCIQIAAVTVLFVSSLSYIYFSYDPEEQGCTVTGRYTPGLTIYYIGTVVVLIVMAFVIPLWYLWF